MRCDSCNQEVEALNPRPNEALDRMMKAQDESDRAKRNCQNCGGTGFRKDTPEGRQALANLKRYDRQLDKWWEQKERRKHAVAVWLRNRDLNHVAKLVESL